MYDRSHIIRTRFGNEKWEWAVVNAFRVWFEWKEDAERKRGSSINISLCGGSVARSVIDRFCTNVKVYKYIWWKWLSRNVDFDWQNRARERSHSEERGLFGREWCSRYICVNNHDVYRIYTRVRFKRRPALDRAYPLISLSDVIRVNSRLGNRDREREIKRAREMVAHT